MEIISKPIFPLSKEVRASILFEKWSPIPEVCPFLINLSTLQEQGDLFPFQMLVAVYE